MADMGTGGQTLKSGNSPGTHEAGHCPHSRWEAQGYTASIWGARLLSKAQLCPAPTPTSQWPYGVSLAYCHMKTARLGNVKATPQAAASTYPVSDGDEGPGVQVPGRAAGRKQPCEPQREPHPAPESKSGWHRDQKQVPSLRDGTPQGTSPKALSVCCARHKMPVFPISEMGQEGHRANAQRL